MAVVLPNTQACAEDVSAPAILQWFEASYDTMDRRSADMFLNGYGAVWIPPTGRADISDYSVGYDVYDRFDLGRASRPTLYGTAQGLKGFANRLHQFDGRMHVDAVLNHNAYSENDYVDPQFTDFAQAGGYPGFVLQNPDGGTDPMGVPGTFGDFHDPIWGGHYLNGQLSGLLDFDHGTNHMLIRHPVTPGDPNNIPAGVTSWSGRISNLPDAANRQFYPDTNLPGDTYFDPKTSQNVTVYPFNTSDPTAGDAVQENAIDVLKRYMQWMVQEVGVDGFRLDAAKHMEHYALEQFDTAVYRSNPRLLLDGSQEHVFMYGEVVPGSGQGGQSTQEFLANYIRKDINPATPGTIGGNRDVLDFALRQALNDNLSFNGLQNDWNNVVNSSMDSHDDFLHNGSAGVMFVSNHDGGGAQLTNVAHAYILTQPGESIVYYNADQFDDPLRVFPVDGRGDALGNYDDSITKLVSIRNTHGRGDYRQRWLEKEYFAMERSGSMLVLLDNRNDAGRSSEITMDVDFPDGTPLVELTGNAAAYNATALPGQELNEVVMVQDVGGQSKVSVRFLHNDGQDQGYLVYGLQTPKSLDGLEITNSSTVIAGGTPDPGNVVENAVTRLSDLQVVTANSIDIRLETQAVTLPGGIRDQHADGDNAVLRVNNGVDTNGSGSVDYTTPGSVVYGFEEFDAGDKSTGYTSPSGDGWYQESIDATVLPEGYNFVTVRAFRHGVGGPAVFEDFRQVVYLDRVAPDSEIVSFDPYGSAPEDLDLVIGSVDQTADNVHVFLNVGATHSDAEILSWVSGGSQASGVGGGEFKYGVQNVVEGNHVATVVMYEITGSYTIKRYVGLSPATGFGAGFGDTDHNGFIGPSDMLGFETALYAKNDTFEPTADTTADGLVDNLDLFGLDTELLANGASQPALDEYIEVLTRRGDLNADSSTNAADVVEIYNDFGLADTDPDFWTLDLNVDGVIDVNDVATMITEIVRSLPGDFDLDGDVDGVDFLQLQRGMGTVSGALYTSGDASLNGVIDQADIDIWAANFGFVTSDLVASAAAGAVPEPTTCLLAVIGCLMMVARKSV